MHHASWCTHRAGGLCHDPGEGRRRWRRRSLPTADRAEIRVRRRAARCCWIRNGDAVEEIGAYLGVATNNVAEWTALVLGLEAAREARHSAVGRSARLRAGRQATAWRVSRQARRPAAAPSARAQRCCARFAQVDIRHVPRKQNALADRLVNRMLDQEAQASESRRVHATLSDRDPHHRTLHRRCLRWVGAFTAPAKWGVSVRRFTHSMHRAISTRG